MSGGARHRAEEAMELLSCETFAAACKKLDDAIIEGWRRSKSPEERELLHLKQQALRDIRANLRGFIEKAAREESKEEHSMFKTFLRNILPQ